MPAHFQSKFSLTQHHIKPLVIIAFCRGTTVYFAWNVHLRNWYKV